MVAVDEKLAKQVVTRDLGTSVITLSICLALQLFILLTQGPSHDGWPVYVGALASSLGVTCVSLLMARRNWIPQAMHLFAWSGMAAVIAMTISAMRPGNDLPELVILLICAGVTWLYQILGWVSASVYGIAALISFLGLGWVYNQWDDVVPAIIFLGLAARFGSRLWHDNRLRTGVRMVTNGGRPSGT